MESIERLVEQMLADHARSTCSSTTRAARSAARSSSSYDRFHDFERTMQLNYFGAVKLIIGAAAAHARARLGPHRQRLLDRRADQPAALLAPTWPRRPRSTRSRACVGSEVDRRRRHVHDDPHAARAHADDRADEDLRLVPDDHARRGRRHDLRGDARASPSTINTRLGTFGEVAYALAPKAVDQILHMAYKVFPDSAAAKGEKDERGEGLHRGRSRMAHLMRGVHW